MGDRDARSGIVLDILGQEVGIDLSPVAARARMPRRAVEIAAVSLVPVCLYEARRAPGIGVDGLDAVAYGLLAEPDLSAVVVILGVTWCCARRPWAAGLDAIARPAGPDPVTNNAEAGACRRAEQVVERLLLYG